jgi:nicotinamidase/pyrazinamidase
MKKKIAIGQGDALMVVDMQNDFTLEDGALYVAGIEGEPVMLLVITHIKKLLEMPFEMVGASGDFHPIDHVEAKIFGPHCVKGTKGSEIFPGIFQKLSEKGAPLLIAKGENSNLISYSVATSNQWPEHIADLRRRGIKRVFLCGLAYTHCVGESARDYASQGFETYIVRDATRSVPPPYGDSAAMDKKLSLYGVKRIKIANLS